MPRKVKPINIQKVTAEKYADHLEEKYKYHFDQAESRKYDAQRRFIGERMRRKIEYIDAKFRGNQINSPGLLTLEAIAKQMIQITPEYFLRKGGINGVVKYRHDDYSDEIDPTSYMMYQFDFMFAVTSDLDGYGATEKVILADVKFESGVDEKTIVAHNIARVEAIKNSLLQVSETHKNIEFYSVIFLIRQGKNRDFEKLFAAAEILAKRKGVHFIVIDITDEFEYFSRSVVPALIDKYVTSESDTEYAKLINSKLKL